MMNEVLPSAQQIACGAHLTRIYVGHRKHTATEHDGDLLRVDLVVLRFPAMDRFHVQRVTEDELDLVIRAEICDPVPGEYALDPNHDVRTERLERTLEVISVGRHVPIEPGLAV